MTSILSAMTDVTICSKKNSEDLSATRLARGLQRTTIGATMQCIVALQQLPLLWDNTTTFKKQHPFLSLVLHEQRWSLCGLPRTDRHRSLRETNYQHRHRFRQKAHGILPMAYIAQRQDGGRDSRGRSTFANAGQTMMSPRVDLDQTGVNGCR